MKKNFLSLTLLGSVLGCVISFSASAQIVSPVRWSFTATRINATTYEVHISELAEGGWKIYGQQPGNGPTAFSCRFLNNPQITPVGKLREVGKLRHGQDQLFGTNINYYLNQVDFVQRVNVKGKTNIKGVVQFMVSDEKQALPPSSQSFNIPVG